MGESGGTVSDEADLVYIEPHVVQNMAVRTITAEPKVVRVG